MAPLTTDLDPSVLNCDYIHTSPPHLTHNMTLLLNILNNNEDLMDISAARFQSWTNRIDDLHFRLLLLTYEQSEALPSYRCEDEELVDDLNRLVLIPFEDLRPNVVPFVFEFYQRTLTEEGWKKQLACIHGFRSFCVDYLQCFSEDDKIRQILAIGHNLISYDHVHYKIVGLRIYDAVMEFCDIDLIRLHKYHETVYNDSLAIVGTNASVTFNNIVYDCLVQSVRSEYEGGGDPSKCAFDEAFCYAMLQFEAAGDSDLADVFMKKIIDFCVVPYEFWVTDLDANNHLYFEEIKECCQEENPLTKSWTEKLMEMIIRELPRLQGPAKIRYMNAFHSIYITCFANIDASELGEAFSDFTDEFLSVLESVVTEATLEEAMSIALVIDTMKEHQKSDEILLRMYKIILDCSRVTAEAAAAPAQ